MYRIHYRIGTRSYAHMDVEHQHIERAQLTIKQCGGVVIDKQIIRYTMLPKKEGV